MIGAKTGIYSASASGGPNLFADATASYSLRDLGLGATNAIRVRRSSDNAEQDIGFDSNGDLNTSSLLDFVGGVAQGYVTTWYEQSGNSNDLTQNTASNQCKIVDGSGLILSNGQPAIQGISGGYYTVDISTGSVSSSFVVAEPSSTGTQVIHGGGAAKHEVFISTNGYEFNNGIRRDDGGTVTLQQHIITSIFDTLSNLYVDGNHVIVDVNAGTNTRPEFTLFGRDGGGVFWGGTIQEMILFDGVNKTDDQALIEANINAHYNTF